MPRNKTSGARWTGDGTGYVPGVPQRDLSMQEWAELSEQQRTVCLVTGLYVLTGDAAVTDSPDVTEPKEV